MITDNILKEFKQNILDGIKELPETVKNRLEANLVMNDTTIEEFVEDDTHLRAIAMTCIMEDLDPFGTFIRVSVDEKKAPEGYLYWIMAANKFNDADVYDKVMTEFNRIERENKVFYKDNYSDHKDNLDYESVKGILNEESAAELQRLVDEITSKGMPEYVVEQVVNQLLARMEIPKFSKERDIIDIYNMFDKLPENVKDILSLEVLNQKGKSMHDFIGERFTRPYPVHEEFNEVGSAISACISFKKSAHGKTYWLAVAHGIYDEEILKHLKGMRQ